MALASRLTGGLAWAGLVLVVGVPAANVLWPTDSAEKQAFSASAAPEDAPRSAGASAAVPAARIEAVASVKPKPEMAGPEEMARAPLANPRLVARGSGDLASAAGTLSDAIPETPKEAAAAVSRSNPEDASGPLVEATTDSVTIIPRGALAAASAATPEPASPAAPEPAAPRKPALAEATPAENAAGTDAEARIAPEQVVAAAPAPAIAPPVPAPLSQRPPSRPVAQTQTASISVRSRPEYVAPPAAYSPSPSIVVIDPPAGVRPLPDDPDAPIVTEDELRGWKSGTLAQYLASKGLLHRGARRPPDLVETRPNGYVDRVPSDGQYYDEGDPGYPYAN